jgi:hypothetical protein
MNQRFVESFVIASTNSSQAGLDALTIDHDGAMTT